MRNFLASLVILGLAAAAPLAAQSHTGFRDVDGLTLSGRVPAQVDSLLQIEQFLAPEYVASLDSSPCLPFSPFWHRFVIPLPEPERFLEIQVVWRDNHPEPQPQLITIEQRQDEDTRVTVGLVRSELPYVEYGGEKDGERYKNVLVLTPSTGLPDRLKDLAQKAMQIHCR